MKLTASIILSIHLLTTSAQDSQPFKVPKVGEINGDFIRNRINSKIGMDFSKFGDPIPIPVGPAPTSGNIIGTGTSGSTETKDSSSGGSGGTDSGMVKALDVGGGSGGNDKLPTNVKLNDL
jgi:hypothetical protein